MTEKTKTLAKHCANKIREDIFNGKYKPGQALKLVQLQEIYEVGCSPIREALFSLQESGIVLLEENKGFKVNKFTAAQIVDMRNVLMKIEVWALELAMEKGDAQWEADIVSSLHQLAAMEKSRRRPGYHEWSICNLEFHACLVKACSSPILMAMREGLYQKAEWYHFLFFTHATKVFAINHQEHHDLAMAVIKRKKRLAITLLKAHFRDWSKSVIPILDKKGLIKI